MTELSSFPLTGQGDPVVQAVILILSEGGCPARDLKKAAKKLIGNTGQFLNKPQHLHETGTMISCK